MHPDGHERPSAPDHVYRAAHAFFDEAARLLGHRLAESRFDPDRGLRVTVIDLDDSDLTAIHAAATTLQVDEWVRVEHADPDDLATWERLRHDLIRLSADRHTLQVSPTPDPGYRRPPVEIRLFANAQSEAAALHEAYGDFVTLHVGALPYPPSAIPARPPERSELRHPTDPTEMTLELDTPLSIPSGATTTHTVVLTNHSDHDVTVHTNGVLTADVVDDHGAVVGGFVGPADPSAPAVHRTARRQRPHPAARRHRQPHPDARLRDPTRHLAPHSTPAPRRRSPADEPTLTFTVTD